MVARRPLGGYPGAVVLAGGDLWVSVQHGDRGALLALDPLTLAVERRTPLAWSGALVAAGGSLWVGGNGVLRRVDEATGAVTATVPVPGGAAITLGGGAAVLVDGESTLGGIWRVQRRYAATGALLAQTPASIGVTAPLIGGVVDGGVWIHESTGMQGFVERLDLATLHASPASVVRGSNGVLAEVDDGRLWVTQGAAGQMRNYCADPATGREIAPLPAGVVDDENNAILAIADGEIYWDDSALRHVTIYQAPVPAACRP